MAGISEADVHKAMRQLKAAGSRLSTHTIRKQLGDTGSLSTIEKYRKTFQPTPPPSLDDLVREEVARALRDSDVLTGFAVRLAKAEAEARNTVKAFTAVTTKLAKAEERIDELERRAGIASTRHRDAADLARRREIQVRLNGKAFE